jgi:hypothetical protein
MTDPSASPENEFSYVDKTTGRSIAFTPKRDEAVVTFREPMDADTLDEAVREAPALSISEGFNADLGFAAVHVESTKDTDAAARAGPGSSPPRRCAGSAHSRRSGAARLRLGG